MKKFNKLVSLIIGLIFMTINFTVIRPDIKVYGQTSPLKLTIKASESDVMTGNFVTFNLRYDILEMGKIQEGDKMEFELTDNLTNVLPMYSKQHFKEVKVEGNKVTLTVGPIANTALQGFISLGVSTKNDTKDSTDGIVKAKFNDEELQSKISI